MSYENLFLHPLSLHRLDGPISNATSSSAMDASGTGHSPGSGSGSTVSDLLESGSNQSLGTVLSRITDMTNSSIELDNSSIDEGLASFIHAIDICLAFFSGLNFVVNVWLLLMCSSFVRNGCSSSSDTSERRPHYGLHLFIFNCAISSVMLEAVGSLTNIGYLFIGDNLFTMNIKSDYQKYIVRKTLDFVTYGLFNVTHLNFVLLLNVDKLLYILRPLHYHEIMNRRRVSLICVGTWLAALAMASPSLTIVDINAQLRQEAILFAMCVVCPAAFDLLSAIIVSTIVFRIQLRDSNTRRSVMGPRRGRNRHGGECMDTFVPPPVEPHTIGRSGISIPNGTGTKYRSKKPVLKKRTIRGRSGLTDDILRNCNVFLRTFTPIIWTCLTTLPYTSTMIYLYFGADGDDDFIRRWTDDTTFKVLRAFGCLYITYFTGVPFIIVFNYHPYRRKIKAVTRLIWKRLHSFYRRIWAFRYRSVDKHELERSILENGVTSMSVDGYTIPQTMSSTL